MTWRAFLCCAIRAAAQRDGRASSPARGASPAAKSIIANLRKPAPGHRLLRLYASQKMGAPYGGAPELHCGNAPLDSSIGDWPH
jgi:hypothetical protein